MMIVSFSVFYLPGSKSIGERGLFPCLDRVDSIVGRRDQTSW